MECSKNKSSMFQEFDACNYLDDLVLNMLTKNIELSFQDIIKQVRKKITVTESTINTCLFLLNINDMVSYRHAGKFYFYKITDDGNRFLKENNQIITKIFENGHSFLPSKAIAK